MKKHNCHIKDFSSLGKYNNSLFSAQVNKVRNTEIPKDILR